MSNDLMNELVFCGQPSSGHAPRTRAFDRASGDVNHIQLIEDHITRHLGAPDTMFHELAGLSRRSTAKRLFSPF